VVCRKWKIGCESSFSLSLETLIVMIIKLQTIA
jgi:hypothetical protein